MTISERGIEVSKAGGSCRIYENWQMVEGEHSCQRLLATGESTQEEAGGSRASLSAFLIKKLACRAVFLMISQCWVLHNIQLFQRLLRLSCPPGNFGHQVPGSDVPVLSVTWSCWSSDTNWCPMALSGVDKVLVLTPFLFMLGFFWLSFLWQVEKTLFNGQK